MIKILIALLVFVTSNAFSQMTDITAKVTNNIGRLNAYLHQPNEIADKEKKRPLVIALHGCNQSARELAEGSGWNELADYFGFYVLYPEQREINNFTGCFNWFLDGDIVRDKGEIGSIHEMLNYVKTTFFIDTTQVFIYGVSAGAMMAVNFLANYPNEINSGAILAGGAYKTINQPIKALSAMRNPKDTTLDEWARRLRSPNPMYKGEFPKLVVIHGTSDKVVAYKNSELLVKQWKTAFEIVAEKDSLLFQSEKIPSVICRSYWNQNNEAVIRFYTIENWGHSISINPGKTPDNGGKETKYSLDGGFFSTYQICKDWSLTEMKTVSK